MVLAHYVCSRVSLMDCHSLLHSKIYGYLNADMKATVDQEPKDFTWVLSFFQDSLLRDLQDSVPFLNSTSSNRWVGYLVILAGSAILFLG